MCCLVNSFSYKQIWNFKVFEVWYYFSLENSDFFVMEPKQLKIDCLILDWKGLHSCFNER